MDSLVQEVLDQIDLEARMVENPFWELRDFDEYGFFYGPKHIADEVSELLEEI